MNKFNFYVKKVIFIKNNRNKKNYSNKKYNKINNMHKTNKINKIYLNNHKDRKKVNYKKEMKQK